MNFYCVVSLKQNKALNSGSYLVHDQKDVRQWPIEEWIKIFVCQVVWWGQVLDVCQFWLRGQGRVYTWCWLPVHPGLIIVALKNWSLRLTLIIWIGFCSIFDSRAETESQICYIYISIESHIWELDVLNVHIIESHFWELDLLYQSYFNAVVKFGILLLNISSYLILYYPH